MQLVFLFQHAEIYNFTRIYFVGSQANKRGGIPGAPNNAGYDDDNGSYLLVPHDHIAYRYEILKVIGKGSFGQVCEAKFSFYTKRLLVIAGYKSIRSQISAGEGAQNGGLLLAYFRVENATQLQFVALKLVRNEKRFHRQAEEEIRILDHLREQDNGCTHNVIHMLDHFSFRNHKCITFELMSINLYELIKKNRFNGFNLTVRPSIRVMLALGTKMFFSARTKVCPLNATVLRTFTKAKAYTLRSEGLLVLHCACFYLIASFSQKTSS